MDPNILSFAAFVVLLFVMYRRRVNRFEFELRMLKECCEPRQSFKMKVTDVRDFFEEELAARRRELAGAEERDLRLEEMIAELQWLVDEANGVLGESAVKRDRIEYLSEAARGYARYRIREMRRQELVLEESIVKHQESQRCLVNYVKARFGNNAFAQFHNRDDSPLPITLLSQRNRKRRFAVI